MAEETVGRTSENGCDQPASADKVKILVAEDDAISRCLLESSLVGWGYDVVLAEDGNAAWKILAGPDAPPLAILDWMMPGLDGPSICRNIRAGQETQAAYLILLTARDTLEDLVAGLESGADDYVTKPFNRSELRARVAVGIRILRLQSELAERVRELELSLSQVKQLRGLLPICMYCKRIRNDSNYWVQVESYISKHSEAEFSHGICPDCYQKLARGQQE